jgi:hypothetical protein
MNRPTLVNNNTNNRNQRRRDNNNRRRRSDIVHEKMSWIDVGTMSSGIDTIPFRSSATQSTRFATMQDLYRYYRITHIRATIVPTIATVNESFCVMWVPGATHTAPVNQTDCESEHMVLLGGLQTVPEVLIVPRNSLVNLLPWYLTDDDGDDSLNVIGNIFVVSSNTSATHIISMKIDIDVEFKDQLDPDVTLARMRKTVVKLDGGVGFTTHLCNKTIKVLDNQSCGCPKCLKE